jgi:hypothetical protein
LNDDSTHRLVTDSEKVSWNSIVEALPAATSADVGKFLRVGADGKFILETVLAAEEEVF